MTHEYGGARPSYDASAFDAMLEDQRPDTVIVTTADAHHDEYIVRSMESGCDVLTFLRTHLRTSALSSGRDPSGTE